jgi:hypothetical protein
MSLWCGDDLHNAFRQQRRESAENDASGPAMTFELEPRRPSTAYDIACRETGLTADDRHALERAVAELERHSFAARLTALLRRETGVVHWSIPANISEMASRAAGPALETSLKVALRSLARQPLRDRRGFHKGIAALAGGAGGAFGLTSFFVELPFTTTIMLRAIADIARNEGEDLADPSTIISCLAVFGLGGGRGPAGSAVVPDDEAIFDAGYFAIRALLAKSVGDAARFYLGRSSATRATPLLARYLAAITSRFGVAVSQKLAAQAVPVIGAAAGAAINYAFVDHFQTVAHGHFTVLRLERRYGAALVRAEYEQISRGA